MSQPVKQSDEQLPENSEGTKAKKPYQPPAWEVEEVFETTALACRISEKHARPPGLS